VSRDDTATSASLILGEHWQNVHVPMSFETPANIARSTFAHVAAQVDGARLVRNAFASGVARLPVRPDAFLAIGKVAFPMYAGLTEAFGEAPPRGLLVAPETRFPENLDLPNGISACKADHPNPTERSLQAGQAARNLMRSMKADEHVVVLLSGGASSLVTLPADDLTLADLRDTVRAVARGGATISELNTVRKHLSAVKGGQLGMACAAKTVVLALSDVVGNDPGTIASGPFSPDETTFTQALDLVCQYAPAAPERARRRLEAGARGQIEETPKSGDPRLSHVSYRVIAGPDAVRDAAAEATLKAGLALGDLKHDTEDPVPELAAAYGERARTEARACGIARSFVGNGEPSIVVNGDGCGGRATHLALLMAREIRGLNNVSFLAAGTDDRDGSGRSSGGVVDGQTWDQIASAGVDPALSLERCDSETALQAADALVRGPGSSNLLDLHLLTVLPR